MLKHCSEAAATNISARRCRGGPFEHLQPPRPLDCAHEVEVFHDRHYRYSAHTLQHTAAHEDRLIAIGQPKECDPQCNAPFDPTQERPALPEPKGEGAAGAFRVGHGLPNSLRPAALESSIGMQKEDDIPRRFFTAHPELAGASRPTGEDPNSGVTGQATGLILTAAVDHDDFDPRRDHALDASNDARSLVECRDHDRDCHRSSLARTIHERPTAKAQRPDLDAELNSPRGLPPGGSDKAQPL